MITHSYIVSVLESYAIARRQIRWLSRILPETWELIFVDDGSDPSIELPEERPTHFVSIQTGDKREWTQHNARNLAAAIAEGDYLLMTDIDHVFTPAAIELAEKFTGPMLHFSRKSGVLDEDLTIRDLPLSCSGTHLNTFLIRRSLFAEAGRYSPVFIGRYGGDVEFLRECEARIGAIPQDRTAPIYAIPEGQEQFHNLKRPW